MWRTHLHCRSASLCVGLMLSGLVTISALAQNADGPGVRPGKGPPQPGAQRSSFVENDAGVRLDMLPAVNLAIGTDVTFRITTREPGYLVVVNVDPAGKVRQVYPPVDDVLQAESGISSNRIDRGQIVTLPQPRDSGAGSGLRIAPPPGLALALAILCDQPVQLLDLPDVPPALAGRAEALAYVAEAARALRLASAQPNARSGAPKWSFNAKFYLVDPP